MASRDDPRCYSKKNQKEGLIEKIQSCKIISFSRKRLSLEDAYISVGISENLINRLGIGTPGDISIVLQFKFLQN